MEVNNYTIISNVVTGNSRHIIAETCSCVCASHIEITLTDDIITSVYFTRGCNGNTKGIAKLVEGMQATDVIKKLSGIDCHGKGTSCPDQLAKILAASIPQNETEAIIEYGIPDAKGCGWEKLGEFTLKLTNNEVKDIESCCDLSDTLYSRIHDIIKNAVPENYPLDFNLVIKEKDIFIRGYI